MTEERKVTGKDIYLMLATLTSIVATVAGTVDDFIPEPYKHWFVVLGALSTALHGALMDPRLMELLSKFGFLVLASTVIWGSATGCAAHAKTTGQVARTVYTLTDNVISTVESLHRIGAITDQQYLKARSVEHTVALAGLNFTRLARAGMVTPVDAQQLMDAVHQATLDLRSIVPDEHNAAFAGAIDKLLMIEEIALKFGAIHPMGGFNANGKHSE